MEEFGPTPAQVEETPIKRRQFLKGNFLRSWLDRRDDDDEEDNETDKSKSKKPETKAKDKSETAWKPERLRDRFNNFFKGLVSLDMLPAGAAEAGPEDQAAADFRRYELLASEPQAETEQDTDKSTAEDGVLAVSAHAQRRYYGHELTADETEDGPEALPEIEVDDIETEQPVEHEYGPAVAAEASSVAGNSSGSAEAVGDVIRRRQEDRLNRRVKRLRRQSRNMHHQQADMAAKQSKFEDQLDKNQKAQEKLEREIVPKMEADRKKLRRRLDDEPQPQKIKFEIPTANAVIAEGLNKQVQIKTETIPQIEPRREVVQVPEKVEQTVKIESLQPTAEKLEDDGYRETYYERRHEVKDDPGGSLSPVSTISGTSPPKGVLVPPPAYSPASYQIQTTRTGKSTWSSVYKRISPKPGPDMYKQSAINGAVGGIIILVLLGLLTLVR